MSATRIEKMLIIGERINTIKKSVFYAFQKKDDEYIRNEAIRQAEAGANIIDINAGSPGDLEPHNMAWAVEIVQDTVDIPICIDSPNPKTIKAGFDVCRNKRNVWLNSITLEKGRMEEILPIGKEYNCPVIALCMDEKGINCHSQYALHVV
jgi:5-methyltetrahydrofolate--homocysteine methyltransferase